MYVGEFGLSESKIIHLKVFNLRCENSHINHYDKLDLKTENDLRSKLKNGYIDRSKEFSVHIDLEKHLATTPYDKLPTSQIERRVIDHDSSRSWLLEVERVLETHYPADSPIFLEFKTKITESSDYNMKVQKAREWLDNFLNRGCQ
jgi:hypothetical protein